MVLLALATTVSGAAAQTVGVPDVYSRLPPIDDRGRDQIAMFRAWNPDPLGTEAARIADVDPRLAAVVRRAQAVHPGLFVVGSGRRTSAEQRQAERWNWSPAGGARLSPALRKHLDGQAVDLWPLDRDGRIVFTPATQARVAAAMKAAARETGVPLGWGGDWRSRKDPSHFELR